MLHDALQAKPGLEKGSLWSRGINRFQEMSQTADAGSRGSSELLPLRPLCQGWASQGPTELAPGHRCPPGHCHCHLRLCRGLLCAVTDLGGSRAGGFGGQKARGFCLAASTCPRAGSSLAVPPFPPHCHSLPCLLLSFFPNCPDFCCLIPSVISCCNLITFIMLSL